MSEPTAPEMALAGQMLVLRVTASLLLAEISLLTHGEAPREKLGRLTSMLTGAIHGVASEGLQSENKHLLLLSASAALDGICGDAEHLLPGWPELRE